MNERRGGTPRDATEPASTPDVHRKSALIAVLALMAKVASLEADKKCPQLESMKDRAILVLDGMLHHLDQAEEV